uniref:Uncharacterized protein n=1 Tax=Rhizophora mucronata TaxID=61149 RepID=A0A2P2Q4Z8_RHIMU
MQLHPMSNSRTTPKQVANKSKSVYF